uniref:hypothetical protein n=1 Tax=uncultured Altererythrobacter sp. TaxID=500840 RepID=UPI002622DDED|nr:hypothetical protein [uncultured Altererythrobacter sp.]
MNDHNDNAPRTADTTGSSLSAAPSYDIAPEDHELAESLSNFDPVADVPSPTTVKGGTHKPITGNLSSSMLPPEARQEIQQKLANVPQNLREKRENELVREHLHQKALEVRIKAGPGEGANAFQKERFHIAAERHQAQSEILRIAKELSQVLRWQPVFTDQGEPVIDPETGQQKVEAINAVQGERRTGMERRIAELEHKLTLLDGPEGDQRERKALWQAVQDAKSKQAQIDIEHEARAKAEDIVRQEMIDAKAEAYTKGKRNRL